MIAMRQLMMGGRKSTAKRYIQDGLVAMWDGIENAGWGKHDPNATTWVDLTGNGYDLTLTSVGSFTTNAFVSRGVRSAFASVSLPKYNTIEVAMSASSDCGITLLLNPISGNNNRIFAWYPMSSGSTWLVRSGEARHYGRARGVGATYAATYSGNTPNGHYLDGLRLAGTTSSDGWAARDSGGIQISMVNWPFRGSLYSVRFYSRALAADEIAYNHSIDKERFNLP